MLIKRQKGWRKRQMCKKLLWWAKHLENICKQNSDHTTEDGFMFYLTGVFSAPWEPLSPTWRRLLSAAAGLKERRRNLEPFNFCEKKSWILPQMASLVGEDKHGCRSNKTSEDAAGSRPRRSDFMQAGLIGSTMNVKDRCYIDPCVQTWFMEYFLKVELLMLSWGSVVHVVRVQHRKGAHDLNQELSTSNP